MQCEPSKSYPWCSYRNDVIAERTPSFGWSFLSLTADHHGDLQTDCKVTAILSPHSFLASCPFWPCLAICVPVYRLIHSPVACTLCSFL